MLTRRDRGQSRRSCVRLVIIACALPLLLVLRADAQFGNNFLGLGLPCAFACGPGRGIVNLRFGADVVDTFGFSSTEDSLNDKLRASGDDFLVKAQQRLESVLADKLKELDALATGQREAFFKRLQTITDVAITDLDQVLDQNIHKLDDAITDQQTIFSGTLLRWLVELGQVLLAVGGILVLAALIGWGTQRNKGTTYKRIALWLAIGATVILGIYAIPHVLRRSWDVDYETKYREGDYQAALIAAASLRNVWPDIQKYGIWQERTQLVREILGRPTGFVRDTGYLAAMLSRIDSVSKRAREALGVRDADLDLLRAMVLWRKSETRLGEYYSAVFAFNALRESPQAAGQLPTALGGAAPYYIRSYLLNPLSDMQLHQMKLERTNADALAPDGIRFPAIQELRAAIGQSSSISWPYAYQQLHLQIIPKYVKLVFIHATLSTAPAQSRDAMRAEQHKLVDEILAAWDEVSKHISEAGMDSRAASLKGLFAIYARAQSYKRTLDYIDHSLDLNNIQIGTLLNSEGPVQPKHISSVADLVGEPCFGPVWPAGILKNIPPRSFPIHGAYEKWFASKTSPLDRVMMTEAISSQIQAEDHLYNFEYALYAAMVKVPTEVGSCYSPAASKALIVDPVMVSSTPPSLVYFNFLRTPADSKPIPADSILSQPIQYLPAVVSQNVQQAIVEAAGLGLFVCSDTIRYFDKCDDDSPRILVAKSIFDHAVSNSTFVILVEKLVDDAASVRTFPIID